MISDARGGHVSPGIYSEEKDVTYSVKSLGITNLGLVGETLYGPAFENIPVKDWSEYVDYFGGTSTEKFRGTGLPKYELPYIAKSYLEESKQLNVVRVLGLSGYDAGKAWIITDSVSGGTVVVLRGKVTYDYAGDICSSGDPDTTKEVVKEITVGPYEGKNYNALCASDEEDENPDTITDIDKFSIKVTTVDGTIYDDEYTYNVSLNPSDSDYIYNVLGTRPDEGNSPIYVDAIYESNHVSSITQTVTALSAATIQVTKYYAVDMEHYNVDSSSTVVYEVTSNSVPSDANIFNYTGSAINGTEEFGTEITISGMSKSSIQGCSYLYKVFTDSLKYDLYTDYYEMYRPAQTPWIVSDVVANFSGNNPKDASMQKLFKFITISDGNVANYQIKVSISRINPLEGTFDVLVRDFNDTDASPVVLEKFSRCNLVPGSQNYIGLKIGTYDGGYAAKSKYITVEMASEEGLETCIPAGFLGFPMPSYTTQQVSGGVNVNYNVVLDTYVKPKKQYFGLTQDTLDNDILSYKGKYLYDGVDDSNPIFLTNGFHMDSILSKYDKTNTFVNGNSGYTFTSVSTRKVGGEKFIPRLINASYINETIYKDIDTRKFTTYFYGGFDGWDVNRTSRTNTDQYKATNYQVNEKSKVFRKVDSGIDGILNLPSTAITSDYYAYLAGYRIFANPQDIDINLFATPGIDWYNNYLLTEDVIDIIEDQEDGRGGDALYIINSPKYLDYKEIVGELEDSQINTSYGATYYPWIKYYDSSNRRYLDLSPTKDVVRNMARTDNVSFPWFAPAGMDRGTVVCVNALHKTTLSEEDDLYNGRVNPIKTFAKDGVKVWGNKTLYDIDSPLNRVNVRRLMIRVKKLVTEAAKNLIFEQYDDTLEKQFRGLVEPILADVKSNRGISDYRIMTEVTPETRDQHILPARILIKPTPSLEYISLTFVVYPESVEFEND